MSIESNTTSHDALYKAFQERIEQLKKLPAMHKETSLEATFEENGLSRRDFMKWAAAVTAMLSLPATFTPLVAEAVKVADRLPIIWLHMAECTGCSESLLRTESLRLIV